MYMTATEFPHLRAALAPEYTEWSDEQIDALVAELYGAEVSAEDVESFWSDVGRGFQNVGRSVGRFAQQAAPVVGRALPAIAQGAITGAGVGGPIGAIVGAAAGGAGGVLSQSRNPTLRGIGGAVGGATQLVSQFTPAGRLGGAVGQMAKLALGGGRGAAGGIAQGALSALGHQGGALGTVGRIAGGLVPQIAGALGGAAGGRGGGGAANALLGLLSRPETTRALAAAGLGAAGRSTVMVGGQAVPVQSILSALGGLAGRAAGEAETATAALPAYYYGADGELAIDPADAEQRTDALLELFAVTPVPLVFETAESDESFEHDEATYTAADARRDAWLMANEAEWHQWQER
jgi:hypothetical protein